MSTPRERGLVDSVYALEQAVPLVQDEAFTQHVKLLGQSVRGLGAEFPVISAWLDKRTASALADDAAERLGYNPLDVDDPTPWAGVETPERAAISNGDIVANATAVVADVSSSAGELADKASSALPLLAAAAFLVGALFLYKAVK